MKIELDQIPSICKTMTVSVFASLPTAWPEYLQGHGGQGIVVAQINPNANHLFNDDDVVARGLVFMPDDAIEASHLRRLTIRNKDLDIDSEYVSGALSLFRYRDYFDSTREPAVSRVAVYHYAAQAIMAAQVIDLYDLFRALRP